ncbi:Peroxisomal membrane protein PEX16 [Mycena sanguinolenta]|uniref:Peroxisomal membrane protein PEX16 n=1 Tax=Mycena sanguinolenta TaxID=230812 RepID=A0A8H6XFM0_9AGAR|nr:Peroxisomal membrane protein PEX16 [Mycena sanguinolenta]
MASSKPESGYEAVLLNNLPVISTLESSLRSLTWFLPGRFKDAELASEALAASLNLVSMYHDTLLAKVVQRDPKYRPLIPSSLHTRFTRAWSDKNTRYKWVARALELIRFTELVLEMTLRRKVSPRTRWRSVVLLEIIKCVLLFLVRLFSTMALSELSFASSFCASPDGLYFLPPFPSANSIPPPYPHPPTHLLPPLFPRLSPLLLQPPPHIYKTTAYHCPPHPLLTSPPHPAESSAEDYLLPKALTTSSVKPSHSLLKPLSSYRDWLAETLYILRPLVYVSLLVSDRRSNRPLVSALILEVISRNLRRAPPPSAALERSEYARRDRDIVWYLLRGSIWESYTKPKLESLADMTVQTPILGLVGALVKDWVPLIDEYYYYTAP